MRIQHHFYKPVIVYIVTVAALVICNAGTTYVLSAIRGFVAGEGFWSKAQKDAAQALQAYVVSGDEKLFLEYSKFVEVIKAGTEARLELAKEDPNFDLVDAAFVRGQNDRRDVRSMAYLFRYGKNSPAISAALEFWEKGDEEIQHLFVLAEKIHARVFNGKLSEVEKREVLSKLWEINSNVTTIEKQFTVVLNNGARSTETVMFWLCALSALVLVGVAHVLGFRAIRHMVAAIEILIDGVQKIGHGEISYRFPVAGANEFDRLSQTLNNLLETNDLARTQLEEKAILETLVSALHKTAIVSMTDVKGDITMVNDRFCEMSGYTREELLGANHRIINSGFHPKEFFADLWKTIGRGQVWSGEVCNKRKDGSLYWVDSRIILVRDSDGKRKYLSIRYDITPRKTLEGQVIQAARLASLGEMAAGMAHEVNNPAGIVLGKVNQVRRLVREESINPAAIFAELEKIEISMKRITSIVGGLLAFSREASQDPCQIVAVKTIVEDALDFCGARFSARGLHVRVAPIPDIECEVRGTQISQILVNLLNNAFDAVENLPEKWISLEVGIVALQGEHVQFRVTDSGAGIQKETAGRIMEPFFTTKEIGKGTGLGLSVSSGIAQAHGGTLVLNSECVNTQFVLTLPLWQNKLPNSF